MSNPQNDTSLAVSPNPADERRAQLAALIPEAFSEGKLDLAALKRALGESTVIEGGERYALTWAGKKAQQSDRDIYAAITGGFRDEGVPA